MAEDISHLPADIQNYMRKLAELDPPIYLTEDEIENYKEAFVDYDIDGSGSINISGKKYSRQ